jgi:hypothetical protein
MQPDGSAISIREAISTATSPRDGAAGASGAANIRMGRKAG